MRVEKRFCSEYGCRNTVNGCYQFCDYHRLLRTLDRCIRLAARIGGKA